MTLHHAAAIVLVAVSLSAPRPALAQKAGFQVQTSPDGYQFSVPAAWSMDSARGAAAS